MKRAFPSLEGRRFHVSKPARYRQSALAGFVRRGLCAARPNLRRTQLSFRQRLLGPHEPIEELHFFDDGVASILADDESGDPVEIGLFGREGMSGSAALLGSDRSPLACLIQIGDPSANTIGTE